MKLIRISAIWCSSCIITHKFWEDLKEKYPNNEYIEYDYDDDEEEIKKYNIDEILPVVIVFKDNKELKRIIGEKNLIKEIESIGE